MPQAAQQEDQEVELEETSSDEVEVEVVETDEPESKPEQSSDELEQYSEGVKKRISKLTAKMREAERREQAAIQFAQSAKLELEENQKKNVLEIARQSGALYDKFCGFVSDLEGVGKAIEIAQKKYDAAENKLNQGRGNLITSVERIKILGAKTNKSISKEQQDKSFIESLPDDE